MDVIEPQDTIIEMHSSLRNILINVYTGCNSLTLRKHIDKAYDATLLPVASVSAYKGFPYVSFGTAQDPYNKRVVTRFGRWYKNYVNPNAPDPEVGDLVQIMQAEAVNQGLVFDTDLTVNIIRGEEIYHAYKDPNSPHSCMSKAQAYRAWMYVFNPEVVGLATTSNGKARALVWQTEQGPLALDRIYPNSGFSSVFLKNWAAAQGWLVRKTNVASYTEVFTDKNDVQYKELTVKFNKYHPRVQVPYLDTFSHLEMPIEKRVLSMTRIPGRDWKDYTHNEDPMLGQEMVGEMFGVLPDWELNARTNRVSWDTKQVIQKCQRVDGKMCWTDVAPGLAVVEPEEIEDDADDWVYCGCCGERQPADDNDMRWVEARDELLCDDCWCDRYFHCENCGREEAQDEGCFLEDTQEHWCQRCAERDAVYCNDCNEWVRDTNAVALPDGEMKCQECAKAYWCPECNAHKEDKVNEDGRCDDHAEEEPEDA